MGTVLGALLPPIVTLGLGWFARSTLYSVGY